MRHTGRRGICIPYWLAATKAGHAGPKGGRGKHCTYSKPCRRTIEEGSRIQAGYLPLGGTGERLRNSLYVERVPHGN